MTVLADGPDQIETADTHVFTDERPSKSSKRR